jgi:hypothetical protein
VIDQQPAEPRSAHPALVAYRARNRKLMAIYAGVLALIVVVAFAAVRLAYAHGDINNVDHASAPAPEDLIPQRTANALSLKWRTDDAPAVGSPVSGGVVVTWDRHTVNGRDARTGDVRWHYTRSDRELCTVLQQDATTTAVYRHNGNCDQVTGFVTATGATKFYRTLTDDGDIAVSSAPNVILIVSKTTVHVIDNAGGLDRWDYDAPDGCQIDRALGGSLGVLISFHCGTTNRLAVHDLINGDKDKTVAKWDVTLNFPAVPILADIALGVIDLDNGDLVTMSADKGLVTDDIKFLDSGDPALKATFPRSETTVVVDFGGRSELAVVGSSVRALAIPPKQKKPAVTWLSQSDGQATKLFDGRLAVVRGGAVVLLKQTDGTVDAQVKLTPPSSVLAGGARPQAYPWGVGLVLAGKGVEAYG